MNKQSPSKSEPSECVACAISPMILPGWIFGIMPIKAICHHGAGGGATRNCSFKMCVTQKYTEKVWLLAMVASILLYIWFAFTTSGFERLKVLSELITCLTVTNVLLFATTNTHTFLLELNGLSSIVSDGKAYGLSQLLDNSSIKKIRSYGIIITIITFLFYTTVVTTRAVIGFQSNFHSILNIFGVLSGGVFVFTLFNQTWIKMFLMMELFRNCYAETKEVLSRRTQGSNLQHDVQKVIRLQVALVRNYKECSRFWSPSMLICLTLTNGNLIIAFYVMVTCLANPASGYDFDTQLQVRTYVLIVGLIVMHATQQRLEFVVSRPYLSTCTRYCCALLFPRQ